MYLSGEDLKKGKRFRYLGVDLAIGGTMVAELSQRIRKKAKVLDVLRSVWKEKSLSIRAKMGCMAAVLRHSSQKSEESGHIENKMSEDSMWC